MTRVHVKATDSSGNHPMGSWIGLAALPTLTALPSGLPVKIVNRCAITVAPRQPFIEWAQRLSPDQPLPPGAFEPGLYLLPAYDTREEAIKLLAQGYEEIFCAELETWSTDPVTWPSPRSLGLFQEWFAFQFFDLVSDQAQEPLAHGEVDESFLDGLRNAIEDSPLT